MLFGCKNETTPSLFDPNYKGLPQPVIDSITPPGIALAAAQPLTVYGKNFSTTASYNLIYFNGVAGTVVSATTTQLVVASPVDTGAVAIKISVRGAPLFSTEFPYRLTTAIEAFGNFTPPTNGVAAVTPDSAGNIYFDLLATSSDNGIYIFTPNGTRAQFAPKTSGTSSWSSLKIGPDKYLYAAKGARALYRFTPTGGAAAALWVSVPNSNPPNTFSDIDFDLNKNLWTGAASGLYCFKPDKSFKITTFSSSVHAVRVFNGYLYFSALKDSSEKVFRATINGDTLGTIEEYFNISSAVGSGLTGQSMTFSSDGYLYIGTQAPFGLIVVAPNGSFTTPYSAYATMFGTQCNSICWGDGDKLYVSTFEGNLLIVHTQKHGAPYLGLN